MAMPARTMPKRARRMGERRGRVGSVDERWMVTGDGQRRQHVVEGLDLHRQ